VISSARINFDRRAMYVFDPKKRILPREFGRAHGEAFRTAIRELADIRIELAMRIGGFASVGDVLAIADEHLPVLARYDGDLNDELLGIAEGSDCTPAEIVALNHYTDMRDLGPGETAEFDDGGCTMLYARTDAGPILAQTWDTHASAADYVLMMRVPEGPGSTGTEPEAWVMSIVGCLAMAGMNRHGVAAAINNLRSRDAVVGIVWPALIRRLLRERSATAAREVLLDAPVGSGHHYLLADEEHAFGIETSGVERRSVFEGETSPFVHTNHCFDPHVAAASRVVEGSTTFDRYGWMSAYVDRSPPNSAEDVWTALGIEGIWLPPKEPDNPHTVATNSGVVFDIASRTTLAAAGHRQTEPRRFAMRSA